MNKTPLFAAHLARNAVMEVHGAWMVVSHFSSIDAEVAAARAGVGLIDLCQVEHAVLTHADVRRWTNGMFTNNTRKLQVGQGNRHAMCDDRGRVRALTDLYWLSDDSALLVLEGLTRAAFEQQYEMYLTLDDIEVGGLPGECTLLSVQGPEAANLLGRLGLPVPAQDHDHAVVPGEQASIRVMRRDRSGLGGFDLLVPRAVLPEVWGALIAAGAAPIGRASLDALRVVQGLAAWPEDGTEKTLVHELNLDKEVCAFDKGCYVGQEVLNRVDIRGSIQKRLCRLLLAEDAIPPQGAVVMLGDEEVGALSSLARLEGKVYALGVLRKAVWSPGTVVRVVAGDRGVDATVLAASAA
jgi:folate-binding protein YgfZ